MTGRLFRLPASLGTIGGLIAVVVGVLVAASLYTTLANKLARLEADNRRLEATFIRFQSDGTDRHVPSSKTGNHLVRDDEEGDESPGPVTPLAETDDVVVIYNRVPKTGSTSFAGVAYDLCYKNKFNVLHLNITKNSHVMSWADQANFVRNVTSWNSKKPAIYHGHVAYIEFGRFSVGRRPIFINLIRDPLDRLVSYYYFMRFGDDFRPGLKRRKSGNKQTFDECVADDGRDCNPENLWLQVPFMCGQAAECWNPGSRWALQQAKHNLVNNYLVVGVTEQLADFIAILEATLPRFFRGAVKLFNSGSKSHLRKTSKKQPLSEETISKIKQSVEWKVESEFYEFARRHFNHAISKTFTKDEDGNTVLRRKQFRYEKIRPR